MYRVIERLAFGLQVIFLNRTRVSEGVSLCDRNVALLEEQFEFL